MNEKAKKVLSYVACAIGGACLGIALLGGLSYCSNNSAREKAETINTIDRVKHNEQITTQEGDYTGYKMTFSGGWGSNTPDNKAITHVYLINTSTWTPGLSVLNGMVDEANDHYWEDSNVNSWSTFTEVINRRYNQALPSANVVRLMHTYVSCDWASDGTDTYMEYWSFVTASVSSLQGFSFIYETPSWTSYDILKLDKFNTWSGSSRTQRILLTYAKSNYFLIDFYGSKMPSTNPYFQDVASYYMEQGYSEGKTAGYSEGYDDAYAEKDTGIAFTSCGVYPNAQVTLATDETIGNFKYMYLCHYITKPGYDEHTIYIMWTTNANTGQYLGEVIDRNDTDSYDPAVTLGSFTQQPTSSVTITATEDMEFSLWVGYITTFHNRGEITNSILWFQGGTSESDLQIYQNGYDEGYQNGNQQGQEAGYENGYTQGKQAGDAEGYERGYNDGFEQTNTQNVFSLFTSAFGAVSSLFDLKIFGFLPLYWFFLAPLFIALISLLMRMVRH